MLNPSTRDIGFWMLAENSPVELLSFLIFLLAGIYGIRFSFRIKSKIKLIHFTFYLFFSVVLVFIAMEEISWGQWFFHFETPEAWQKINAHEETNLHNLKGLSEKTEILRIIYAVGGIIGIYLARFQQFAMLSAPKILLIYFIIIGVNASLDYYADLVPINENIDYALAKSSELMELFIAISAFVYLWYNRERIEASV